MVNIHNTEETKFPLISPQTYQYSVCHNPNRGPCFGGGHDIGLSSSDFKNNNSYSNFPFSYKDILGKGSSIFSGNTNDNNYIIKELEVFKLNK